jgi:hypothetical protein
VEGGCRYDIAAVTPHLPRHFSTPIIPLLSHRRYKDHGTPRQYELLENGVFYNGDLGWKVELSFNGRVSGGVRRVALPRKRSCEFSLVRFCISALDPRTWPSMSVGSSAHKIDFQNGALKVCIRSAVWLQRYAIIQSPKVSYFRTSCHFLTTCFSKC